MEASRILSMPAAGVTRTRRRSSCAAVEARLGLWRRHPDRAVVAHQLPHGLHPESARAPGAPAPPATARVHVKVDSGMGDRYPLRGAGGFVRGSTRFPISKCGGSTHFATALERELTFVRKQLASPARRREVEKAGLGGPDPYPNSAATPASRHPISIWCAPARSSTANPSAHVPGFWSCARRNPRAGSPS